MNVPRGTSQSSCLLCGLCKTLIESIVGINSLNSASPSDDSGDKTMENFTLASLNGMPKLAQLQTLAELVGTDVSAHESGGFRIGCLPQKVLHFDTTKKLLIDQLPGANWLRANEILRRHCEKGKRNPDSWNEDTIGLCADHTLVFTKQVNGLTYAYLTAWNERWGNAGFGYRFPVHEWLHMGDSEMTDSVVLEFHLDRSDYSMFFKPVFKTETPLKYKLQEGTTVEQEARYFKEFGRLSKWLSKTLEDNFMAGGCNCSGPGLYYDSVTMLTYKVVSVTAHNDPDWVVVTLTQI